MADERNFRLLYYDQLGLKNVDQVRALEHLLRDSRLDIEKLSTFALKFALPSLYRPLVWKVLLDVLPSFQTSHKLAERARTDQYKDLEHALIVMRMIPRRKEEQAIQERILWMFLLEEGMISMPMRKTLQRDEKKIQIFKAIATVCCDVMDNEVDAYWITKRFFKLQDKYVDLYRKLPKYVPYYLEKEDKALFEHMTEVQAFKVIPYNKWFESCFAETFPTSCLERIWDKLIAGSCNILVFLCVAILLSCRLSLLECISAEASIRVLWASPNDTDRQHLIVDNALQLWDKHGSSLSIELVSH